MFVYFERSRKSAAWFVPLMIAIVVLAVQALLRVSNADVFHLVGFVIFVVLVVFSLSWVVLALIWQYYFIRVVWKIDSLRKAGDDDRSSSPYNVRRSDGDMIVEVPSDYKATNDGRDHSFRLVVDSKTVIMSTDSDDFPKGKNKAWMRSLKMLRVLNRMIK